MSFFKPKATNSTPRAPTKVPWTEKYRPKSLNDVAAQDAIVSVLKKTLQSSNLPHMLFYGPPGTGKTSTILALARDLYGPELRKTRVLELNASDDRGISVVREKIKNFSRTAVGNVSSEIRQKYPAPDFKLIILDEADMMTHDAQAALRRTMENYAKTTRFCLICNYVTRIIDPLASRCSKFRFKELSQESALNRLQYICEQENVEVEDEEVLRSLLKLTNGDLRQSITLLQSAAGFAPVVTKDILSELAGVVPDNIVSKVIEVAEIGNQKQIEKAVENIILDGYSVSELLDQLHDKLLTSVISSKSKSMLANTFSVANRRLVDGGDEHIELLNIVTQTAQALKA